MRPVFQHGFACFYGDHGLTCMPKQAGTDIGQKKTICKDIETAL